MPIIACSVECNVRGAPFVLVGAYRQTAPRWIGYGARLHGFELSMSGELRAVAHYDIKHINNVNFISQFSCPTEGIEPRAAFEDLSPGINLLGGNYVFDRSSEALPDDELETARLDLLPVCSANPSTSQPTYGNRLRTGHLKQGTTARWWSQPGIKLKVSSAVGVAIVIKQVTEPVRMRGTLFVRVN